MAILNDDQSKELCKKIEQCILKNGYFIFDTDDWSGLHIKYKPFTHGKNYEYADYTEITVTLDNYNIEDSVRVQYSFARNTLFSKQLGDNYTVYYTDRCVDHTANGGKGTDLNEAADFIANRFIGLVEDKIMNKKLEARVAKLERLLKNEILGLGDLTAKEEKSFVSNMFSKYPSLRGIFGSYSLNKKPNDKFNVVLKTEDDSKYHGMTFTISTNGNRKDLYINATDSDGSTIGIIKNLDFDTDVNKMASFILSTLSNNAVTEESVYRRRRTMKNEAIPMSEFDCEDLALVVNNSVKKFGFSADTADDNMENGFLNIGIYDENDKYVTDYDIEVNAYNKLVVTNEDNKVGVVKSYKEVGVLIADHIEDNYLAGF